jgi:hypothetical protein
MIDTFVLLAPIFLLVVIALLGFIGCSFTPGSVSSDLGPTLRVTGAGDKRVDLEWDPLFNATEYHVKRGEVSGVHEVIGQPVIPPMTSYADQAVVNGTKYFYVVSATTTSLAETLDSNEVDATPQGVAVPPAPFVTSFQAGTLRNGEDGWFGMAFVVNANGVTVKKLGRAYLSGNSGAHDLRLIDEADTTQILGSATIDMNSETLNGFKYATVTPADVPLQINHTYYLLSREALGGDHFLTQDTVVTTRAEASVSSAVESPTLVSFSTAGGPNHAYGPVDFQY